MAWDCLAPPGPQCRMWCNDPISRGGFGPDSVRPSGQTPRLRGQMAQLQPKAALTSVLHISCCEMGVIAAAPRFHVWEEPMKWSSVPGT